MGRVGLAEGVARPGEQRFRGLGADVESVSVSAEFLSRDAELMVELVADMLMRPQLDEDEFDKLRSRRIALIQSAKDSDPSGLMGGYGNAFYLSTNGMACNVTAAFRAYKRGAAFANPCYTQIHPTCIPVSGDHQSKLTLMSESLRNDGRVWVPKSQDDVDKDPNRISDKGRDYYLERRYPAFGNLAPRDVSSRAAKQVCDEGRGVGVLGRGVYLDFADAIERLGRGTIESRLTELWDFERYSMPVKEGGRYYYRYNDGLQPQNVVYTQTGLDAEPTLLIDPNTWSEDGTVALASYSPSHWSGGGPPADPASRTAANCCRNASALGWW